MKHSMLINGYDSINLTKLDILDDLAEVKVATKYLVDGKEILGFPGTPCPHPFPHCATPLSWVCADEPPHVKFTADLDVLGKVEVSYVTLPGWRASIEKATTFDELPENCKKYIYFIESFLGVPVEWIGVGPARESMVKKEIKN